MQQLDDRLIAYDVGMNNGDDSEYFLFKGYRVVAIEANPDLCLRAEVRFATEIGEGRMILLNIGVASASGSQLFYIHIINSVLSRFEPEDPESEVWQKVVVNVQSLSSIIAEYGYPDLLKIDIEGYDLEALKDMMKNMAYRPPLISVEAHVIDVLCCLVVMGYKRFQVVPMNVVGSSPETSFINVSRLGCQEPAQFRFKHHSSGPIGEDKPGEWLDAEAAMHQWLGRSSIFGPGEWFDVHACL